MKYIIKIALNKEGIESVEEYEIKLPDTLSNIESQERDIFNHWQRMWEIYRQDNEHKNILLSCNFEDWMRDVYRYRFKETAICWSNNRDITEAHISIERA